MMNKQLLVKVSLSVGGLLVAAVSIMEVFIVLSDMGFTVFEKISLTDPQKIFISLLIFFGLFCAILELASIYFMRRGYTKACSIISFAGAISALLGLLTPNMFGCAQSAVFLGGMIFGIIFMGTGAVIALTMPSAKFRGPLLTSIEVAVVALFSALYAVLIVLTFQIYPVPSPTGGFLHFGDFVVFLVALLFGAKVGGLVGVVGAVVADFYLAYPRWYVSIIAHGLEGVIPGFTRKKSFALQLVACIIGGFLMAATYFFVNIFIKGYPVAVISFVQDLFLQAGVSIVVGLPIVKIVERTLPWLR